MNDPIQRILVVDDEPIVLDSVQMILSVFGYSSVCASGGEQALARYAEGGFDAVLTDHCMPGMKGDQLALAIKAKDQGRPVIMLSGAPPKNPVQGVDMVLLKPCDLGDLRAALVKVLSAPC
jgi:CheY-like chemotaxis protein